jgi:hypothetical protein
MEYFRREVVTYQGHDMIPSWPVQIVAAQDIQTICASQLSHDYTGPDMNSSTLPTLWAMSVVLSSGPKHGASDTRSYCDERHETGVMVVTA